MPEDEATARLHAQVVRAIEAGKSWRVMEPLLERLVAIAPEASEAALLAHRALAEHRIQQHPWRALLHLKHVLRASPNDDSLHAMTAIAHVLLGNFKSATKAYQIALRQAPTNPWYHHNLGHVWVVGRNDPKRALPHLRKAFEAIGAQEPETVVSYIDCLERLGGKHAEEAARLRGQNPPARKPKAPRKPLAVSTSAPTSPPKAPDEDPVMSIVRAHMPMNSLRYRRVRKLWFQVRELLQVDAISVAVLAACVDYAVLQAAQSSESLAEVASRHGVDWKELRVQYAALVERAPKVVDKLRARPGFL
jgi:hypothetical protein